MIRFTPSLLDRLLDDAPQAPGEHATPQVSLEQLKDSVVRDLEALLNARCGLRRDWLRAHPQAQRSILGFGMTDFSSMSLASTDDRDAICRAIESAIVSHEPRLKEVRVEMGGEAGSNRLVFTIQALLIANPAREPVNFNATLQPSTQLYSVSKARPTTGGLAG
jgi:type VI secretion system protein ImpF